MTSINAAHADERKDAEYLQRALLLARRALGGVAPRAPVGAVVVRNGEVVGEGATQRLPGDHAEVVALKQAGARARGASLYCTLEPHAHQGTVPPCTQAIINAGVRRVVCAQQDPNPQVNGAGYRQLRAAGIEVRTDVPPEVSQEATEVIEGFAHHLRTGRPLVTVKYAMTLDGKIATRTGASKWVTGEEARARAHAMRASSDAVLVGIGTVLADDPRLTARVPHPEDLGGPRPRLRVVVDSNGRMPSSAALLREPGDVLWATASKPTALSVSGITDYVQLPDASGRVDLAALVGQLGRRGCTTALVEGGARLLGAFFDNRLVDKVAVFIAPRIFGGEAAPSAVAGIGVASLTEAIGLERLRVDRAGPDLLVTGYVVR